MVASIAIAFLVTVATILDAVTVERSSRNRLRVGPVVRRAQPAQRADGRAGFQRRWPGDVASLMG